MQSKHYHNLLLNEYENRELSKDDLSSTLNYYAELFSKEQSQKTKIIQDFKSRISLLEYFISYYKVINLDDLKKHRENIILQQKKYEETH
jgi:hypothetical protein